MYWIGSKDLGKWDPERLILEIVLMPIVPPRSTWFLNVQGQEEGEGEKDYVDQLDDKETLEPAQFEAAVSDDDTDWMPVTPSTTLLRSPSKLQGKKR